MHSKPPLLLIKMGLHFHGGIGVISAPICSILLRSLSVAVVGLVGFRGRSRGRMGRRMEGGTHS